MALVLHIRGHAHCTPGHIIYTSPVTKVLKNGTFYTQNTKYVLDEVGHANQ